MADIEPLNPKYLRFGKVAFEAYCESVGGLTFDGRPIPGWDELHGDRNRIQRAWMVATDRAIEAYLRENGRMR